MRKSVLIIIVLLFAAIAVYFFATASGHRENIGGLELFPYDATKKYCVYKIINADTTDINSLKNGTKVCIVCRDGWPNVTVGGNQQCYSRITFKSASGVYTYDADLYDGTLKICRECTDGGVYYNKP